MRRRGDPPAAAAPPPPAIHRCRVCGHHNRNLAWIDLDDLNCEKCGEMVTTGGFQRHGACYLPPAVTDLFLSWYLGGRKTPERELWVQVHESMGKPACPDTCRDFDKFNCALHGRLRDDPAKRRPAHG